MGDIAFNECYQLKTLRLNKHVWFIGESALYSVTFEDHSRLRYVDRYAFCCTHLDG